MSSKDGTRWFFYFSLGTVLIIIFKTIDSVYEIANAFGSLIKVIMPFVLAVLIAYILYLPGRGIEKAFEKSKIKFFIDNKRKFSLFFVYLILLLIIFIVFNFLVPSVSESLHDLTNNVPKYIAMLNTTLGEAKEDSLVSQLGIKDYFLQISNINVSQKIREWISLDKIDTYIKNIVGGAGLVFDAFVTIIVSVYVLAERTKIKGFLSDFAYAVLDDKKYELCVKYFRRLNEIFCGFISGQVIDAFIVGVITAVAMTIMKVKYSVLLGVIIGILNIIPYFGAIFGVLFAIIITIFTGGLKQALILAIVVIILQQIDANIINPRILGESLHISPILVIFAVTIGGTYFGPLGMFLGVPVFAMAKEIIIDFINYRNRVKLERFEEQLIAEYENEEIK